MKKSQCITLQIEYEDDETLEPAHWNWVDVLTGLAVTDVLVLESTPSIYVEDP